MDDIRTLRAKLQTAGPSGFAAMAETLADEGRLLQAGFEITFGSSVAGAPAAADLLRQAYMMGASTALLGVHPLVKPGATPTEADQRRAKSVQDEMTEWEVERIISDPRSLKKALEYIRDRRR